MTLPERNARRLLVAGALLLGAACTAVYWPGLAGGFVLDDSENFGALRAWLDGRIGLLGVLATNESGVLGRPLSMLSFAITAWLAGMDPFAFKLGNLLLHLTCGALVAAVVSGLASADPRLRAHHRSVALLVAALWLLAPIQVSTVLYSVQRMSQLSGAFVLLGTLLYVVGRPLLETPSSARRGLWLIYGGVPLCTVLAMLAKENGAVLPLLCAAVECTAFRSLRRPRHLRLSLVAIMATPVLALCAPPLLDRLVLQGYATRDFTLVERLLTQPRVLWDYVAAILLPDGPRMGLIHDDFVLSRGLFDPPGTAVAILAWIAVVAAALIGARRAPAVAAGALMFLAAHAVESTVIPLEIYFEHRNYVAAMGVWLAVVGGAVHLATRYPTTPRFRRVLAAAPALFVLALAFATHARARAWASWDLLLAQSVLEQRDSPRLNAMYGALLLERGDLSGAIRQFERVPRSGVYGPVVPMWILLATCMAGAEVPPALVDDWARARPDAIGANALQSVRALATEIENDRCRGLDAERGLGVLEDWTVHLDGWQPRGRHWRLRYYAARLAARSARWPQALEYARAAARDSDENLDALLLWFQIASSMQAADEARTALARLKHATPKWHYQLQEALPRFEASLASDPGGAGASAAQQPDSSAPDGTN